MAKKRAIKEITKINQKQAALEGGSFPYSERRRQACCKGSSRPCTRAAER